MNSMKIPGSPSLALLGYLLIFLPCMAFKGRRRILLRYNPAQTIAFSDSELKKIWFGTILQLSILFLLAWQVGAGFISPFSSRRV